MYEKAILDGNFTIDEIACRNQVYSGFCLKFDYMKRFIPPIIFLFPAIIILFNSCEEDNQPVVNEHHLPIFEIDIDEKYLWSADSGLYIIGNNGISKDCSCPIPANYNQQWEYPAVIRYTPAGGSSPVFEETVGFRIKGKCSRQKAMKSIGFYWRNEYGNRSLEYPLFHGSETTQFERLLLRNSGNDFGLTHLKDAAVIQIFKDYARVDFQAYSPCILYLNGEYWGIHNLREMISPHHFKYHYNVDDDLVDLLEGSLLSPGAEDGSCDAFLQDVIGYIEDNDLSITENYLTISERIDVGNLIDYIIIETYVGNRDWPVTNCKWWRENKENGMNKWRWIAFDHDVAFNFRYVKDVWIGDLYGEPYNLEKCPGFFIFNNLILNDDFTREFLSRYIFFLETVFDPDRAEMIVMGMKRDLQKEYPRHQEKWHTISQRQWESSIDKIISVNRERNKIIKEIIYELYEEY